MKQKITILGSTGSIGTQTLEVLDTAPGRFDVDSLGANGGNLELLAAQARAVHPRTVAIADSSRAAELKELLPSGVHLEAGPDALAATFRGCGGSHGSGAAAVKAHLRLDARTGQLDGHHAARLVDIDQIDIAAVGLDRRANHLDDGCDLVSHTDSSIRRGPTIRVGRPLGATPTTLRSFPNAPVPRDRRRRVAGRRGSCGSLHCPAAMPTLRTSSVDTPPPDDLRLRPRSDAMVREANDWLWSTLWSRRPARRRCPASSGSIGPWVRTRHS